MSHSDAYIISAHTPYEGGPCEPDPWWRDFEAVVTCVCKKIPYLFFLDGNCQMHATDRIAIGRVGVLSSSPPNNFEPMVTCLSSINARLPTTFVEIYRPSFHRDNGSYTPTKSNRATRIDYICNSATITCVSDSIFPVMDCVEGPTTGTIASLCAVRNQGILLSAAQVGPGCWQCCVIAWLVGC